MSALRKLFESDVSLTAFFNAEQGGFGRRAATRFNTAQSNGERETAGQVSAFGLRPYTLEEKLQTLKRMMAKGKIALAARVTLGMLKHELKKPENDGLGISQMVTLLKEKKLLLEARLPKAALKLKTLAPSF